MDVLKPDICVIGAGSAGLTVAAASAAFGASVVLLEKGKMGGDCLNYGCVPSKALIAAAKHAQALRDGAMFGIKPVDPDVNFKAVHKHVHSVIEAIAPNDSVERFTGLGVQVIEAAGAFADKKTLITGDQKIEARRFVVATGSRPLVPPIEGLSDVPYLTNETLFDLKRLPAHLIVVGGGPIGLEMAQAFRRLGSEVTVLEGLRVLGKDDPELASRVIETVKREGVALREGATVTHVAKHGRYGVKVTFETAEGSETITGNQLLVAVGRSPNVEDLGLEKAGVAYERSGIRVDKKLRTTNRRIFAAGDVAGSYQFTHWAGYQAGLVVRSVLFGFGGAINNDLIPWATYTDPELAHVGLTEEQARKRHGKIRILRWPYAENDRAQAERETEGLVKVITTKRGHIVGADIVGRNAGELIGLWALAVSQKLKVSALTGTVLPYPTLSETAKRAATSFYIPIPEWLKGVSRFLRRF